MSDDASQPEQQHQQTPLTTSSPAKDWIASDFHPAPFKPLLFINARRQEIALAQLLWHVCLSIRKRKHTEQLAECTFAYLSARAEERNAGVKKTFSDKQIAKLTAGALLSNSGEEQSHQRRSASVSSSADLDRIIQQNANVVVLESSNDSDDDDDDAELEAAVNELCPPQKSKGMPQPPLAVSPSAVLRGGATASSVSADEAGDL